MKLTLRQIETIRAVMISGTILGAARQLNVSQPVVSRTMKHIEDLLGLALFARKAGRFVPAEAARDVFLQIQEISQKLADLDGVIDRLKTGSGISLRAGAALSVAAGPLPAALSQLKRQYPLLIVEVDNVNFDDTRDYLLLARGELVFTSGKFQDPLIEFQLLSQRPLVCLMAEGHPLSEETRISIKQISAWPLVGLDPRLREIDCNVDNFSVVVSTTIPATIFALVREGIGIAIINPYSVGGMSLDGLAIIPIVEPTLFPLYAAYRRDKTLSEYSRSLISYIQVRCEPRRNHPRGRPTTRNSSD
jgi:Transcriptional regulator